MVSAGDFRNGVTFEMDGNVYQIIEFQHVKPGKERVGSFTPTALSGVVGVDGFLAQHGSQLFEGSRLFT